jgi:hypothetical protein
MDSIKSNDCPVCGYDLGFPSWIHLSPSDEICPCCGIQYGYDDAAGGDVKQRELIYNEWRNRWIQDKMPWKSFGISPLENWDPVTQLRNLE